MASRKPPQRSRVLEVLNRFPSRFVGKAEWAELLKQTGLSESYLRRRLRELDVPMAPAVEGVRQDDLDALERTLLALEIEYREGEQEARQVCRAHVISARERAGFVLRNEATPAGKKALKEEMILWMRIWLENPGAFRQWVALRKRAIESRSIPL